MSEQEQATKKTRTVKFAVKHQELPVLRRMLTKEAAAAKVDGANFMDNGVLNLEKMKTFVGNNELVEGFLKRLDDYLVTVGVNPSGKPVETSERLTGDLIPDNE